jgi:hypothetical protein
MLKKNPPIKDLIRLPSSDRRQLMINPGHLHVLEGKLNEEWWKTAGPGAKVSSDLLLPVNNCDFGKAT